MNFIEPVNGRSSPDSRLSTSTDYASPPTRRSATGRVCRSPRARTRRDLQRSIERDGIHVDTNAYMPPRVRWRVERWTRTMGAGGPVHDVEHDASRSTPCEVAIPTLCALGPRWRYPLESSPGCRGRCLTPRALSAPRGLSRWIQPATDLALSARRAPVLTGTSHASRNLATTRPFARRPLGVSGRAFDHSNPAAQQQGGVLTRIAGSLGAPSRRREGTGTR